MGNPAAIPHLEALVASAIKAPSSHNTQPWRFVLAETWIELYADRTRALAVNDPEDRELTLSCACALLNLRVAAAAAGLLARVETFPLAGDADCLARVHFSPVPSGLAAEAALASFIDTRRTYRKRFESRPIEPATVDRLVAAARVEGAWLRPLATAEARHQAALLVAEGDAAQWADPRWRRELAAWMHPRRRGDGLTLPALALPVAQIVVRSFDMGGGVGAKDRELAEASPLLAVLGTDRDRPSDWLAAGQALQRVLLTACQLGLQASYLNQPIQVPALRLKLSDLVAGGAAQILLRLGYPTEAIAASPRRALAAVIESQG